VARKTPESVEELMQTTVQTPTPTTPTGISIVPEGFVKVEAGANEQITETTALVVAYCAIWIILMAFTLVTFRALRSLSAHARRTDEAVRQMSQTPH
jgi:hypothetical protein